MLQARNRIFGIFVVLAVALFFGCGPKAIKKESVLDTPENHYSMGMRMLDKGDLGEAVKEFDRATQLNPNYADGYAGHALVAAMQKNFKEAYDLVDKGLGKNDKSIEARIIRGRIITLERKGDDWAQNAIKEYERALKVAPNNAKAYFYMGETYKMAYDFANAANAYSKVIAMKGDFSKEANVQWETMQKIQRAAPGTKIGMEIALIDKIDRADLAVLLMEEMKLGEVIGLKRQKTYDTGFKAPEDPRKMETERMEKAKAITDTDGHWARNWIEEIVKIGGMEPFPDHTFQPNEQITRANYAQVMQQILIMATGDQGLATKYVGEPTRFPDVNSSNFAYNAMALMVDRGMMKSETLTGEFKPEGTMSGADALLAIRDFQNALRLEFK